MCEPEFEHVPSISYRKVKTILLQDLKENWFDFDWHYEECNHKIIFIF